MSLKEVRSPILKSVAKIALQELGAQVIIPEMEIEGKKVIGVGIKGDVAYVVEPNGMEKELKKVLRVKKVIEL
ncbi:hypothetical protein EYM_00975 [Ignicoccus islandicus DSM 13165]|uniref:Uncharacterized protein n=1 Tax=Ignicoccus islandicus DSM 13165 TaxID=940295 RepID=A0A0U2WMH8_9CREN|nr:hypothetical protein [Ignicoccus islandicus]ALU12161.1 hypothetical protein EYM_00975 [Ignicoccus islandicus DSM 13165]